MTLVELYSKDDCHLCDVVKELLVKMQQSHTFELREIKIQEGDDLFDELKERIPVVYINNNFAFQYRISEKDFINRLRQLS